MPELVNNSEGLDTRIGVVEEVYPEDYLKKRQHPLRDVPTKIYALIDLTTPAWDIRYVGKTIRPLDRYLKLHIKAARAYNKRHVERWIRKMGYQVGILELATYPNEIAGFAAEKEYIKLLREAGCNLTNETDGGEGASGFKRTGEENIKRSISLRKYSREHPDWKSGTNNGMWGRPSAHRGGHASKEENIKRSISLLKYSKEHPDWRAGKNNGMWGKRGKDSPIFGEKNYMFGRGDLVSGERNPNSGIRRRIRQVLRATELDYLSV
jgi:hypothetical protein